MTPNPTPPKQPFIDLTQAILRANPAYQLVLFDRLSAAERDTLRGLADDPDGYGVLRPRENAALGVKAVSRDTALLLFSLQQPGRLPRYAARAMGDDSAATLAKMVLDGILQVEADGRMISGPEASNLLAATETDENPGTLAAISRRAIEYAAALGLSDPREISARLYAYNCLPISPRWRDSLPNDAATASYLGLADGPAFQTLSANWRPLQESAAWIPWQPKASPPARPGHPATNYKLYVSPACHRLRETIAAVADAVARSNAIQWKVGKGLRGLLRPDKLVIYFSHFTDLQDVALTLMKHREGFPPHGVPFTAELAGSGLLAWGIDPPNDPNAPWLERSFEQESWRSHLTNRLALALALAKTSHSPTPANAARFALHRLQLEAIDTRAWTPDRGFAWTK